MSSIHVPRVLSQRGKTQLEIERENFEKHQVSRGKKTPPDLPVFSQHQLSDARVLTFDVWSARTL